LEEGRKKLAVGFAASAGASNPMTATVTQGDTSATETQEENKEAPSDDSDSEVPVKRQKLIWQEGFGGLFD